jgi:hypothetical protein
MAPDDGSSSLSYWDRAPPLAALALAAHAGLPLEHGPDPKATNKTIPKLTFASGCVLCFTLFVQWG